MGQKWKLNQKFDLISKKRWAVIMKEVCGHSEICEYLLDQGASVNHKFEDGKTLLQKIVRVKKYWKNYEQIFLKIKNKTMVNNKNSGNVVSLSEEIVENVKKVS